MSDSKLNLEPILSMLGTIPSGLEEQQQTAIGEFVNLLNHIESAQDSVSLYIATVGITKAASDIHSAKLTESLTSAIKERVRSRSFIQTFWRSFSSSPLGIVLFGMVSFGVLALAVLYLFVSALFYLPQGLGITLPTGLPLTALDLILIALCGASGSVASIMTRAGSIDGIGIDDKNKLFITGFFKPIIGMLFGLFVATLFKSGIVVIAILPGNEMFALLSLAFVAGFSERMVQDLVQKVEDKVAGAEVATPKPPAPQGAPT
ncbi:MAG: hypothetical protein H7Y60_06785 [Rhodospirillaceae bacterium]|nr:hypothetical protein [Rhodospirillales bacterium]